MGVVFQEPSLDNALTAVGNLKLAGALFGISGAEIHKRLEDALSELSGHTTRLPHFREG